MEEEEEEEGTNLGVVRLSNLPFFTTVIDARSHRVLAPEL